MALKVKFPVEVRILFSDVDGTVEVETSAHFEYTAEEYPQCSARKGLELTHTTQQETQIKSFAKNVWLPQIEATL